MLNQLPMAINPSVNYNNNFHRIEMPNLGQHPFLDAFVIEANTKTISESIAIFLGIGYDECIQYIGINNFTHCQFPRDGFKGHYMRYKGISLDQLRTLVDIAKSKGAVKFIPTIAELILTQVLPLFNSQAQIKHDDFKKETVMSKVMPTENHSQKFHSDLFGDLTVLTHADGSLWFIGKEVAEKLGYKDTKDAISRHCKGAGKHRLLTGGGEQEVTIIPERDVYRLVMRSKLPTAEKFEDFVVSDILPSIRKTGVYGQSSAALPNFADPAEAAIAWANQYKEKSALQLEVKQIETQITEDKPYTTLGKMMTMIDGTVKVGDYAIMLQNQHNLKIGQNRLFAWFREHGYLCKEERYKNRPTQKSMEQELFAWTQRMITTNGGVEVLTFTPRLTGKAQAYFLTKLLNDFTPETADKDRHEKDI